MPKPYDLTTYDGRRVDWLTRKALEATADRLDYADGKLDLMQGSYNGGAVSASAGTHDGGGVVDLSAYDAARKVLELRRTGFAAWYRPAIPGLWGAHIHAVLIGNAKLSTSAKAQVSEYLAGGDGLKGNGKDTGPRQFVRNRFTWPKSTPSTPDPEPKPTRISKARVLLEQAAAHTKRAGRKAKIKTALDTLPSR